VAPTGRAKPTPEEIYALVARFVTWMATEHRVALCQFSEEWPALPGVLDTPSLINAYNQSVIEMGDDDGDRQENESMT
jgi:hypothetical protein